MIAQTGRVLWSMRRGPKTCQPPRRTEEPKVAVLYHHLRRGAEPSSLAKYPSDMVRLKRSHVSAHCEHLQRGVRWHVARSWPDAKGVVCGDPGPRQTDDIRRDARRG